MNVDDQETKLGKITGIDVEEMMERMMQIMNGVDVMDVKIQMRNHKKKKGQILHYQENSPKKQIKFMELSLNMQNRQKQKSQNDDGGFIHLKEKLLYRYYTYTDKVAIS